MFSVDQCKKKKKTNLDPWGLVWNKYWSTALTASCLFCRLSTEVYRSEFVSWGTLCDVSSHKNTSQQTQRWVPTFNPGSCFVQGKDRKVTTGFSGLKVDLQYECKKSGHSLNQEVVFLNSCKCIVHVYFNEENLLCCKVYVNVCVCVRGQESEKRKELCGIGFSGGSSRQKKKALKELFCASE